MEFVSENAWDDGCDLHPCRRGGHRVYNGDECLGVPRVLGRGGEPLGGVGRPGAGIHEKGGRDRGGRIRLAPPTRGLGKTNPAFSR